MPVAATRQGASARAHRVKVARGRVAVGRRSSGRAARGLQGKGTIGHHPLGGAALRTESSGHRLDGQEAVFLAQIDLSVCAEQDDIGREHHFRSAKVDTCILSLETSMKRSDLSEKILDIKREKGWTWKYICDQIGGMSPILITSALLGQMKLTKPQAANAGDLFGLSKAETAMLTEVPMRGSGTPMPPTDPLIYRFYELVMVNGPAWKALIEEEFGDGIMSAIDFDVVMERLPDPKGDRVKITMSGKFLPYKYYGASGNVPPYGYKEE